jgi:hypothetical protein
MATIFFLPKDNLHVRFQRLISHYRNAFKKAIIPFLYVQAYAKSDLRGNETLSCIYVGILKLFAQQIISFFLL